MEFGDSVVEYRGSMVGGLTEIFFTRCARVYSLRSTVYGWTRCARSECLSLTEIFFLSLTEPKVFEPLAIKCTECTEFFSYIIISHR